MLIERKIAIIQKISKENKSENVEIFKYPDPSITNTIIVCADIKTRIFTGNKILRCTR